MTAEEGPSIQAGVYNDLDRLMRLTKTQEDDFIRLGQVVGRLSSSDVQNSIFVQD